MSRKSLDEVGRKQKRSRINSVLRNRDGNADLAEIEPENDGMQLLPHDVPDDVGNRNEVRDHRNINIGVANEEEERQEIVFGENNPHQEEERQEIVFGENNVDNGNEYWDMVEAAEEIRNAVEEIVEDNNERDNINDDDHIFHAEIEEDYFDESDNENEAPPDNRGRNNAHAADYNRNQPLFHGAQISIGQSMLLILALLLHHNLTMSCIEDIIIVLELHCLREGLSKNSLFKFEKYFGLDGITNITKHYYCSTCYRELRSANEICPTCLRTKNSYFVELPFLTHLQEMYARPGFYDLLQLRFQRLHVPGVISDIYDGSLYQTWWDNGFLSNPHNISFSWYTDGIPVFKSSKTSIWPLYLTINELPFKHRKRRQNTLLAGFWYGDKKPHMNTFLYKFRPELERIANGIEITLPDDNNIIVRGVVLVGTCDLPAKCECLNFVQFNGYYGCPACLCKGRREQIGPTSFVHVYPYENILMLRTSAQCIRDAHNARPDEPVNGVKGHSSLSRIMPDFITGLGIDRMHGVDGGVVKKMLTLLFDPKYRHNPFSLCNFVDVINSRLKGIKPPKFIHRMPRSVGDLVHWKASELKMFFFYYSIPVFEGVMRIDYFENYLRLLTAMAILSSVQVTELEIAVADNLLHRFVREFEVLYGIQFCSINIHQLLHLADCVRKLGPLWVYTCYEYEDINGQLLKLIHGTWHIDTQVANSQSQFIRMMRLIEELPEGGIRDFCLSRKKQVKVIEAVYEHCYSVGTYKMVREVPDIIRNAMENSGVLINDVVIWQYFRLLKNEKLHVSAMYRRELQTQSSVVKFLDGNRNKLGMIHCFIKVLRCNCRQVECNCISRHFAILQELATRNVFVTEGDNVRYKSDTFLHKCHETENIRAVAIENIIEVCVYMNIDHQIYIALPINDKELE